MKYRDLFDTYVRPLDPQPSGIQGSGSLQRPVAAVIFDVYGTLFASGSGDISAAPDRPEKQRAVAELLSSHGIGLDGRTAVRRLCAAVEKAHAEKRRRGVDCPEVRIDRIWMQITGTRDRETARRLALGYELIVNPPYPMPHLDRLLAACRSAGLKMGIISNAQFYTPLMFAYFCGGPPRKLGFDPGLIFYSYVSGRAKPCTDMFEAAARRLATEGTAPGSVLFVGNDMLNDICPADRTGFQTALFAGDGRSLRLRKDDPGCADLEPDLVVTDLCRLGQWLQAPANR